MGMIQKHVCDFCSAQLNPFQNTERPPGDTGGSFIPLTRKRNGEPRTAEICDSCLKDIAAFIDDERAKVSKEVPALPEWSNHYHCYMNGLAPIRKH